MITKVQKVHKVLLNLLDPAFSKSIPFFWSLDEGIKLEKTIKIFLIYLHNRFKKEKTPTTWKVQKVQKLGFLTKNNSS